MATEHTLQLKAVLDTQQVQQQLQQLKQAQQGNAAASPSAGGLSQQSVATMTRSFANINSTLQRLNTSIQQLNRGINQLQRNAASTKIITRNINSSASGAPSLRTDNNTFYRLIRSKRAMAFVGGYMLGSIGEHLTDAGHGREGAIVSGLGKGISSGVGAAFTAKMIGGKAAAAAGPIGIAVAAIGVITSIKKNLDDYNESVKQAIEAQRELSKTQLQNAHDLAVAASQMYDRRLAEHTLFTQNTDIAKSRLQNAEEKLKIADNKFFELEHPAVYTRKIQEKAAAEIKANEEKKTRFDKYTFNEGYDRIQSQIDNKALKVVVAPFAATTAATASGIATTGSFVHDIADPGRIRSEKEINEEANKEIKAYQEKYNLAVKEVAQAEATYKLWKAVNDQLKSIKEDVEDRMSKERIREANRKVAVMDETRSYVDQFRYDKAFNKTQIFANGVLGNQALAPRQQFDQLAEELDKLREQRNSRLTEAYDITRKLMLTNPKDMTAGQYEDMSKSRKRALSDASALDQRIAVLETAMTRIKDNIVQPDVSHVTSLAQYGFGMGEKDRTVEVMQKYYSKMENLTRAIKDKLDQGITTRAVYDF